MIEKSCDNCKYLGLPYEPLHTKCFSCGDVIDYTNWEADDVSKNN